MGLKKFSVTTVVVFKPRDFQLVVPVIIFCRLIALAASFLCVIYCSLWLLFDKLKCHHKKIVSEYD